MAYFAQIDSHGYVLQVIGIDNTNAPDPAPSNSEPVGRAFIAAAPPDGLGMAGTWVQTSYHGSIRKQYASTGYRYDPEADVFIAPQPFPSWTLDGNHDWQPPTPMPSEGGPWRWDEDTLSWVEVMA